jgi:hypothetical protein
MATIVTEGEMPEFEKPELGFQHAVCSHVTDIGEQQTAYGMKEKVVLSFELNQKMSDGRPFMISNFFTKSLYDQAALRAFLKNWRGKDLTADELKSFDLDRLIGVNCMLNLVENVAKNGKTYVNIGSIAKCAKETPVIRPTGQPLPEWIAKKRNRPIAEPPVADDGTVMF